MQGRLFLYLVIAVVPLTGLAVYLALDDVREDQTRAQGKERAAARVVGTDLDNVLDVTRSVVSGLSLNNGDDEVCGSLGTWHQAFPEFLNVGIYQVDNVGRRGVPVCAAIPATRSSFSLEPEESLLGSGDSRDILVSAVHWNEALRVPVIPVCGAMRLGRTGTRRIVFASLDLRWLNAHVNRTPLPDRAELSVLDRNGLVVARNPPSREYVPGKPAPEPDREQMRRGNFDGEVGGYYVLSERRRADALTIVLRIPTSQMFQRARERLVLHLGVLLTVIALIWSLAWSSSQKFLVRPLARVGQVADRLAAGDLSERTGLVHRGEIGRLAASFDAMAEAIQREKACGAQMLESLRALTARLDLAAEEERTRISREFHDELGQQLTVIQFELDPLTRDPSEAIANRARDLMALVQSAGNEVRRIATDLRPAALDFGGLPCAIEHLARDFQRRTGVACDVAIQTPVRTSGATATCLFRICQESLTNIGRHAGATHVDVLLASDADHLTMTISDNGRGFVPCAAEAGGSLGLLGMRERARIAGGTLEIDSAPGCGTLIVVKVPAGTADG
jgi:signal transduction histidine kinase